MADNNTLGLDFVINDATKPGLNSAWNNVTQMTNKMAKELELDVTVKFPDIAQQISGFEKQVKAANREIGKFTFGGQRFDKRGRLLDSSYIFDYTSLKGKLDYNSIKESILPQLEQIKKGLGEGTIKSGDIMGVGAEKEAKALDKLIGTLTRVKNAYELVLRTQGKFNTQATTRAASIERAAKERSNNDKLGVINGQIADAKNLAFTGYTENDLQKQIQANKKLAKLLRERYNITKRIKDLNDSVSYEKAVGALKRQVKEQQEAARYAKEKAKYEKVFAQEANKSGFAIKTLSSLVSRYFSAYAVASFGKKIAETTGLFDQQRVALEGILRSASAANKMMEQIKTMALESPRTTFELTRDVKQLAAYGVEEKDLLKTTKELNDIAAGLGVSMDRLVLAYGQVRAASVLRGQELRQFTEAGIPLVQLLADKFTELNGRVVTTGEVFQLISKRQVSFQMVADILSDMTKEGGKFYKMQERLTGTIYGQMEKTKDVWTIALDDLGNSADFIIMSIIKGIQQIIKHIKSAFAAVATFGLIKRWDNIKIAFASIRESFVKINSEFREAIAKANTLGNRMARVESKVRAVGAAMKSLFSMVGGFVISAAIGAIVDYVSRIKELNDSLDRISDSFYKDTNRLKDGLDSLLYQLTANHEGTKAYNEALETLKNNYKDFINPAIIDQLIEERRQADETAGGYTKLRDAIQGVIVAKQQYEESKAKTQTAGEAFIDSTKRRSAFNWFGNVGRFVRYGDQFPYKNDREDAEEIINNAIRTFVNRGLGKGDMDLFGAILEEEARAISRSDIGKRLSSQQSTSLMKAAIFGGREWEVYNRNLAAKNASPFNTIAKRFMQAQNEALDFYPGKDGSKLTAQANADMQLVYAAHDLINSHYDSLKLLYDDDELKKIDKAKDEFNKVASSMWNTDTIKNTRQALLNLADSLTGIGRTLVMAIAEYFKTDTKTTTPALNGTENVPTELAEFVNNLKNAYDVYKKATGGMGAELGLGYMKYDSKMQERFGGFFGGMLENAFKDQSGKEIKIGGRYVKDILNESFIGEGMENGVLNFEKGMRAVAKSLHEFAQSSPKARKQFESLGKSLLKTADAIAKDNVDAKILEMNNSLEKLAKTFGLNTQAVNIYRSLMERGIEGQYGGKVGVTSAQALAPDATMARKLVMDTLAVFNANAANIPGMRKFDTGNISTYAGVSEAIQKFSDLVGMQDENFKATELGQTGQKLIDALEGLKKVYENELSKISGKTFTGDSLSDLLANSTKRLRGAQNAYTRANANSQLEGRDEGALEEYLKVIQDVAKDIYDEFKKRNPLESFIFNRSNNVGSNRGINFANLEQSFKDRVGYDSMPEALQIELRSALRDLQTSVDEFNSNVISFMPIINGIGTIANARSDAKSIYDTTNAEYVKAQQDLAMINPSEYTSPEEYQAALAAAEAKVAALKEELIKLGEDGEKLAQQKILDTLKNMKNSASTLQNTFSSLSSAVSDIVNAFRSFTSVIHKVYDIMNDGENPEWMQELDGFLEDFIDNFQALIAPISAVLALIGTMIVLVYTLTAAVGTLEAVMTPLLIVMAAIIATAAIVAAIIAAVQAHDKRLQREIEDLDKQIKTLENSMKNLDDMAKRMTGWEKFATSLESVSLGFDMAMKSLMQYVHEMEMHNTDLEAAEKYYQNFTETLNEFFNSFKDMQDEITGSVDDWASAITDSLRNAFQSGENAARSMRDTVKEMIGDIINNMINMTVVQPLMEKAMETLLGASTEDLALAAQANPKAYMKYIQNRLTDEAALKSFEEEVMSIQDAVIEFGDKLGGAFDYWTYNSELSSLSGGIENITEDTARRLEALSNSQLGEVILIRKAIESMGGTFDGTSITSIQAEAVRMNSTLAAMLAVSQAIHNDINDMRNNVRPLWVRM